MRPSPKAVAQARAVIAAERKARRSDRETRVEHKNAKPSRGRKCEPGYLAYLRRQPCCIGRVSPGNCSGPIQACHVRYSDAATGKTNSGMQRKPHDRHATSCCERHHREQHAAGNERRWWASYGLNGLEEAARLYAAYEGEGQ